MDSMTAHVMLVADILKPEGAAEIGENRRIIAAGAGMRIGKTLFAFDAVGPRNETERGQRRRLNAIAAVNV